MDYQEEYQNPPALLSIPEKKLLNAQNKIKASCKDCANSGVMCERCSVLIDAVSRYAAANIPVDYWSLDMENFKGDKVLYDIYHDITKDIHVAYDGGLKYCFAGNHGIGKSLVSCCILKRAVEAGYSALYVTLTDIVTLMTSHNVDKYEARQALLIVDFLVIDEFDPRFMGSDSASDLYGRVLELTLRHRIQNRMPLLLCTNSPNVTSSFSGALKNSISSLMNIVKTVSVLGSDYRGINKK